MDLLCGVCDSPHKIFTTEDTEKKSLSPLRKGGQQDVRRFAAPRRIAPLVPSASSVVISELGVLGVLCGDRRADHFFCT
jgi:hypothetical protein